MKCPNCSRNQLRGKEGMQCKKCHYEFVFDPKSHFITSQVPLNDAKFLSIVEKTSRTGTYHFTKEELYINAAKKARTSGLGCSIFVALFLGVWFSMATAFYLDVPPFHPKACLGFLVSPVIFLVLLRLSRSLPSRSKWDKMVKRWEVKRGPIPGLIKGQNLIKDPEAPMENDIFDYGAGRIIICQDDVQVDWLVLNGFHTQNGSIVVAESGYPKFASEKARELLEANRDLDVYLLRNAGEKGAKMKARVESSWPVSNHRLIDVGLTEEMVARLKDKNREFGAYGDDLPIHALSYHHFSVTLSYSVNHEVTLEAAAAEVGDEDGDGGDGDFG